MTVSLSLSSKFRCLSIPRLPALSAYSDLRNTFTLTMMYSIISQPTPDKIRVLPHHQYHTNDHLSPATVNPSPMEQFQKWLKEAVEKGVPEPEAMTVATATPSGVPSARVVLLKQVDARGFVFYTNYTSRKSQEILANPHAALAFYWKEIHRSVRVVGRVERATAQESDEYFQSRPVGSQLGAWASKQSSVIGENELEERLQKIRDKFGVHEGDVTGTIPTPEFWGGWRVIPNEIEFWSGKPSRLHDRVRYLRVEGSSDKHSEWKIERLSP